jgi:hypothetical protein
MGTTSTVLSRWTIWGPLGLAFVHHAWKEVVAAVTSVRGRGKQYRRHAAKL